MTNWKETTLGELIKNGFVLIHNNKRAPLSSEVRSKMQGQYPYYGAASAIDFVNSYKFDGSFLLIAEDGTVFDGKAPMLQLVNGKFWVSNHSHVLQGKDQQATKLLYYILKNVSISPYITGAVQPKLTKENLNKITFSFPENELEQKKIAGILGSLDEKIELLRKENETLEKLAQTLFKRWFVDFEFPADSASRNQAGGSVSSTSPAKGREGGSVRGYKSSGGKMIDSKLGRIPEGWRVGKMSDVVNITGGTTPDTKNSRFWGGDISWTSPKDLSGCSAIYLGSTEKKITKEGLKNISSGLLPKGTLLLSSRAPIGYVAITDIPLAINQGYIAFLPGASFSAEFMLFWLRQNMDTVIASANGSTFLEISKKSFRNIDIVIPSNEILKNFQEVIQSLLVKDHENLRQIESVVFLRDTLLPKLMSKPN